MESLLETIKGQIMSGEAKTAFFRRTKDTTKSNKELHEEFSKIILYSPVTRHMKFYGKRWSGHQGTIDLYEHGDKSLPKWQQEDVAIKGTFEIGIHLYESWSEDWELIEDENNEGSFTSLARKFAKHNNLQYFEDGFTGEFHQKTTEGHKHHYIQSNDKNLDKICELWLDNDFKEIVEIMEVA